MKFAMVANTNLKGLEEKVLPILSFIEGRKDASVLLESSLAERLGRFGAPIGRTEPDMVITLGGDGTILWTFQSYDRPVFAIHAGHVGFLTTVGYHEAIPGLERVLRGDFRVEKKLRLRCELNGERLPDCTNEATVHTSQVAKIRRYEVLLDGQVVARFRSDGMIISTPTGSTSYAMSVGGPILAPGVEALILSPISPYKLSSRPYVLPPDGEIVVRLLDGSRSSLLVLDGQVQMEIDDGDELKFTASDRRSELVHFGRDFFERVNARLSN